MKDKNIELNRYDQRAKEFLKKKNNNFNKSTTFLNEPYEYYFESFKKFKSKKTLLEIGAGMGENTLRLIQMDFEVCATDISPNSIDVMKKKFSKYKNFSTMLADMEKLPFEDSSIDLICSAGSLSYGNNQLVMSELYRVLKLNGAIIIVDSLNENLIYKVNRYFHYLRKKRSKSTLINMPSLKLINNYIAKFGFGEVKYFGSLTWLYPILSVFFSENKITEFSNWFDAKINVKKSAFKFVLILKKILHDR